MCAVCYSVRSCGCVLFWAHNVIFLEHSIDSSLHMHPLFNTYKYQCPAFQLVKQLMRQMCKGHTDAFTFKVSYDVTILVRWRISQGFLFFVGSTLI